MTRDLLRRLPRIDALVERPAVAELLTRLPRDLVVTAVRDEVEARRQALVGGDGDATLVDAADVERAAIARIAAALCPSLRRVLNATGVVLHTNLGRAPLGAQALREAAELAAGYSNLEYDLGERQRGSRYDHAAHLLTALTGAEAALVVNNNAAALVLSLAALAAGREVIVSRGELIEIGGSFRIPDICETGGAVLREVGTTNRTHLKDYEAAIGPQTAVLLKVHRSNFAVTGFVAEVDAADLATLGRQHGLPAMEDLGSGAIADLSRFGLPEPTVADRVARGLDLVTFSGDKLLGGPQAGVIVGRADLVGRMRRHPLMRALRVGKLTLALLERTLLSYRDGSWRERIPALAMLSTPVEALEARAERLRHLVEGSVQGVEADVIACEGRVGGGALPMVRLASRAVRVRFPARTLASVEGRLREGALPLLCRIENGGLLLDVRTLMDSDLSTVAEQLRAAAG